MSTFRPPALAAALLALAGLPLPATRTAAQAGIIPVVGAQTGNVTGVKQDGDRVDIQVGPDRLRLRVCAPDMVQLDYQPGGKSAPPTRCLAPIDWPQVPLKTRLDTDPLVISTTAMTITVKRSPCRVSVADPAGHVLLQEQDAQAVRPSRLNLIGQPGSQFFGLRGWAYLDHAGSQQELAPSDTPYIIKAGGEGETGGPFVWSNRGYGVYVDTAGGRCAIRDGARVEFSDLTQPDTDYFVMVGDPYRLHTLLDQLTGLPPMFPRWALGLFNSEFAAIRETDTRDIVAGYRSRHIPFDTYVFDFDWKDWSGDNYGEWRWNPTKFPNGASGKLKQDMDAQGVKMVGIMKPRIHTDTVQGRYATAHDFWVHKPPYTDYFDHQQVNDLDFTLPACRRWFWEHSEGAFDTGIVGWWNDEADAWGDNFAFMTMAQAEYEGQRAYTHDQKRVYTLNRNFLSGSQRYAYATWSGDIDSGFGVMQDQRARLLAALNIGQAQWGMDTGGFNNANHIQGDEASECYARWMEFSAFVPIFRLHGTSRRQPWLYGPTAEAAATKAIRLRYALQPYLYAYDHTLTQTGIGLCRPLLWDHPDDPKLVNDVDAWMVGDWLLVAPVVDKGQTTKTIYLPAGTWTDYFRGTTYTGPQTIDYPVNSTTWDDIPLFLKRGAILPTADVPDYTGQRPITTVSVDVFPGSTPTTFTYYDDDGLTYNYEKGSSFSQTLTARPTQDGLDFTLSAKTGTYTPPLRYYLCKFHTPAPQSVHINGRSLGHSSDPASLAATPGEGWATGVDVYGDVTWVKVRAGTARKITLR